MKKHPKLLIFDLDNTLYDENQYFSAVFKHFCKLHKIPDTESSKAIQQTLQDEVRLTSKDIFQTFLQAISLGFNEALHEELYQLYTQIHSPLLPFKDANILLAFLPQN